MAKLEYATDLQARHNEIFSGGLDGRREIVGLHERIDRLMGENTALKAQVERLKAPATDEEWDQFNVTLDPGGEPLIPRSRFNKILAARAAEPTTNTEKKEVSK
jgi:hypothetical protein